MPCDNAIPMSKVISRREERERRLQPRTSDRVVIELTIERSELINKMNNLASAIAAKPEQVPENIRNCGRNNCVEWLPTARHSTTESRICLIGRQVPTNQFWDNQYSDF